MGVGHVTSISRCEHGYFHFLTEICCGKVSKALQSTVVSGYHVLQQTKHNADNAIS